MIVLIYISIVLIYISIVFNYLYIACLKSIILNQSLIQEFVLRS